MIEGVLNIEAELMEIAKNHAHARIGGIDIHARQITVTTTQKEKR